ncbi:hypothetical protein FIE12Z_622 [Fusarium flagelliforme]|uniref:Uncharacterized protein n=2 Tax=Fusarium flagelliforme TaxID=2675880 RepID=A0A395N5E1_9HYPO|nr:hypothetical protein FIE12Z_622 [Fusarium flagelliforme]
MGRGRNRRDRSRSPRRLRGRNHYSSRSGSRRRDDDRTRRSRHDSPQRHRSSSPRDRSRDTSHRREDRSRTSRREDMTREFYERRYVDLLQENDILRQDIRKMQTAHHDELAKARRNADEALEAQELASMQLREDLRSSQQKFQAKEILFLEEENRLLEELMSANQSMATTVTANPENSESSPKPAQGPRNLPRLTVPLLKRLNDLNLLYDEDLTSAVLLRLTRNVNSINLYNQLWDFLQVGQKNRSYCLTHVEDKGSNVEHPPSKEWCRKLGHTLGDCLVVRVIEKGSVRQLGVRSPTFGSYKVGRG